MSNWATLPKRRGRPPKVQAGAARPVMVEDSGVALFDCEPLAARISVKQCQTNRELARGRQQAAPSDPMAPGRLRHCLACPVGETLGAMTGRECLVRAEKKEPRARGEETKMAELPPDLADRQGVEMEEPGPAVTESTALRPAGGAPGRRACRNHPDRLEVIFKNGLPSGKCQECIAVSLAKANAARLGKKQEKPDQVAALLAGRPELLEKIVDLAAQEERTPEQQVIYMVRQWLARQEGP